MRDDLGVGFGRQADAGRRELIAQLGEILDDAVVDDSNLAVLAHMRVSIAISRAAVRGPPRMPDPGCRLRKRVGTEQGLEVDELASLLADLEAAVGNDRDPGGVVAAVLQAPQARYDDLECLLLPDIPNDSAHELQPNRWSTP